jgi:hypothetical protein
VEVRWTVLNHHNMSLLSLQGSFKIDVYNPEHELVNSTDYMKNFITSTGLSYLYSFPLCDSFKYLSIGSGSSGNSVYTDGLESGDSRWQYKNNYVNDANGTINTSSGIDLYRAWLISGLDGASYANGLDINEIMVTPSNAGTSGLAFARQLPALNVPSGNYSIVTYRLEVAMPTGVKSFNGIINDTLVNAVEDTGTVCRYWDVLSGKYGLVHHGLKTINSAGATQLPEFGAPMEPSETSNSTLVAYLSTDNRQFTVNGWSGGKIDTGDFQPYNGDGKAFGSGIMVYHNELNSTVRNRLLNARRDNIETPDTGNFRNESTETVYQKNNSILTITPDSYTVTGRSRSTTRLYSWPNVQNQFEDGNNVPRRIKSMVMAYYDGNYKPYVDFLFASSGLELDFPVDTGAYTIDTTSFTGDYVFIDPYDNLSLSTRISWSSPCPPTVSGCPGYV